MKTRKQNRSRGRKRRRADETMQISHTLDSEALDRIDRLAELLNKSRSLMIGEIVAAGVPILEGRQGAASNAA